MDAWPSVPAALLAQLAPLLGAWPGHVALAATHLDTGERWALGDRPMPAASLVKLLLAVAAYQAAEAGVLDLEETVTVAAEPEDDEADFDNLGLAPAGKTASWRKIIDRAITESDNAATNALLDRLGLDDAPNGLLDPILDGLRNRLKLLHTTLSRRMLDATARAAGRENWTTASETAELLAALYRGDLLAAPASAELLSLLGQQRSREKLATGLSSEAWFGNKTGELDGYRHDAGLVVSPNSGTWAIAALVAYPPDLEAGAMQADALLGNLMRGVNGHFRKAIARERTLNTWLNKAIARHAPDRRVALGELKTAWEAGALVLQGQTTVPALVAPPAALAVTVTARYLVGETGVVTAPLVHLRGGDGHAHELVSQARLGDALVLLEMRGDWVRVQAADGYLAWARSTNIGVAAPGWRPTSLVAVPLLRVETEAGRVLQLSACSQLQLAEAAAIPMVATKSNHRHAAGAAPSNRALAVLPDGERVWVPRTALRPLETPGTPEAVLTLARQFLGLPYLWGGTTGWGIDCSGLVQLCYGVYGAKLPRDADQQQEILLPVTELGDLLPGDPVFFPGHVGLWLGDMQFIHAAAGPGYVTINSFDPASPIYDSKLLATFTGGGRSPLRTALPVEA